MSNKIKKITPYKRSMPGKRQHGEKVRAHALKVGEITWAWNSLHSRFCLIFRDFVDTQEKKIGSTIWNAITSDKTQREILRCLVDKLSKNEEYGKKYKGQFDDIKYALDQADKLSSYRNAFVHTPMIQKINDGSVTPFNGTVSEKYAKKVKDVYESKGGFIDLRGDIIQLEQFVSWTHLSFSVPDISLRGRPVSRVLSVQKKR